MGGKTKIKRKFFQPKDDPEPSDAPHSSPPWSSPLFTDQSELTTFLLVLTFSQTLYYMTMYPSLAGGDSGELVTAAKEFGVAHPPGYPLYTILAYTFNKLLPIGTTIWKLNLLATMFSSAANGLIFLTVKQASGNTAAAVLTAGWCGFSRLYWLWSIQAEIFSLNNLLTAGILLSMVKLSKQESSSSLILHAKVCAVMCGVAMSNQHTSLLIIAPGAAWVLGTLLQHGVTDLTVLTNIALHGLSPLLLYLQLPLSSYLNTARHTWGTHHSLANIMAHILREHYGTLKLSPKEVQASFVYNLKSYFWVSEGDFTIVVWVVAAVTMGLSFKLERSSRKVVQLFCAMFAVYMGVFCYLANLPATNSVEKGVLDRFWIQPSIVLLCIAGIGLGEGIKRAEEKSQAGSVAMVWVIIAVGWQVHTNFSALDQSGNYYVKKHVESVLSNAPNNSLILSEGDFNINPLVYHTVGEDVRPDICTLAVNLLRTPWYFEDLVPRICPEVVLPHFKSQRLQGDQFYDWKRFYDLNYDRRPILNCAELLKSADTMVGHYEQWPWGLCYLVVRVADNKDFLHYYLREMPSVDFSLTPLPTYSHYTEDMWEWLMMEQLLGMAIAPVTMLTDKAAHEADKERQLEMMELAVDHLQTISKQVYKQLNAGGYKKGVGPKLRNLAFLHETLGHRCLLLYTLSTDAQQRVELEKCARTNWKEFTELAISYDGEEKAGKRPMFKKAKNVLALKDFSSIVINPPT